MCRVDIIVCNNCAYEVQIAYYHCAKYCTDPLKVIAKYLIGSECKDCSNCRGEKPKS